MTIVDERRSPSLRRRPSAWIRARIVENVQAAVGGTSEDLEEYREPVGDRGLLGPESPAWLVHGDLAAMLYGGFAALMLQTLHPRAMAGVAQHSNYQNDPTGRLIRTARFVAGTTFGPTPFVDRLFAEVLGVHAHVQGLTADGVSYSAADPDLVTWVHVTEVRHFLRSYTRYGPVTLGRADEDRYFFDTSPIPIRLGATFVPKNVREVEDYFASMRIELRATPEALEAVHFLRSTTLATDKGFLVTSVNRLAHLIVVGAAIDLLPRYAQHALGIDHYSRLKAIPRRTSAYVFAIMLRWALGPSRVKMVSANRIAGHAGATGRKGASEQANENDLA